MATKYLVKLPPCFRDAPTMYVYEDDSGNRMVAAATLLKILGTTTHRFAAFCEELDEPIKGTLIKRIVRLDQLKELVDETEHSHADKLYKAIMDAVPKKKETSPLRKRDRDEMEQLRTFIADKLDFAAQQAAVFNFTHSPEFSKACQEAVQEGAQAALESFKKELKDNPELKEKSEDMARDELIAWFKTRDHVRQTAEATARERLIAEQMAREDLKAEAQKVAEERLLNGLMNDASVQRQARLKAIEALSQNSEIRNAVLQEAKKKIMPEMLRTAVSNYVTTPPIPQLNLPAGEIFLNLKK